MFDYGIIGAGIVGLATAYQLSRKQPHAKIIVLDKEPNEAAHQSSHNSGVLHSGIYYKPDSLKAQNCIAGYQEMLRFLDEHQIGYELCGKVIIATSDAEVSALKMLMDRGKQNGLSKIEWLEGESEIKSIEPYASGRAALRVPYAGIVKYADVCSKLVLLLRANGHEVRFGFHADKIQKNKHWNIVSKAGDEISANCLIDAAGLYSDRIAHKMGADSGVRIVPFRGEYYLLRKQSEHKVKTLIYPVPNLNFPFLGVHFTRMMGGGVEAGPNAVLGLSREGYSWSDVNIRDTLEVLFYPGFWKLAAKHASYGISEIVRSLSKDAFVRTLQKLMPDISAEELDPGGSGVRAQALRSTGALVDDFSLIPMDGGLIVANAPSPAATSSLAIGATIADKVISLQTK